MDSFKDEVAKNLWIQENFKKLECVAFIASKNDPKRCGCGRFQFDHSTEALKFENTSDKRWNVRHHTKSLPTDAYGVIEFEGSSHPSKAHYIRLSYDSKPAAVMKLLTNIWKISLPHLVISVVGGLSDFSLHEKLKSSLGNGLLQSARTAGAWIITSGVNAGVVKHVGDAFTIRSPKIKLNTVVIGIAPWGVIEGHDQLRGHNVVVPYNPMIQTQNNYYTLNSNHSYFLLVDNGTEGSFISSYLFRKLLERYFTYHKFVSFTKMEVSRHIPLVVVSVEGGLQIIKDILQCITDSPPVPVVVCDGSGRASDLVAFFYKHSANVVYNELKSQFIQTIAKAFGVSESEACKSFDELTFCLRKKHLITIFDFTESEKRGLDHCILTSLLETQFPTPATRLSLTLSWNRVDLARDHIFNVRQDWSDDTLNNAMIEALINNKVDFVRLFLENGMSIQKFLTVRRLEELYNSPWSPSSNLALIMKDVKKNFQSSSGFCSLLDIGLVVEKLMGFGFRCSYTRKSFKEHYGSKSNKKPVIDMHTFAYPYNELLLWAVLTKRHRIALFVWERGEQALAKALIAMKLNKALAREAELDELEPEISQEFLEYAREFSQLSLGILDECYKEDDNVACRLLTCEMKSWSDWTCLYMAAVCHHKEFIAHQCCQMLLNDMWMGGMNERKYLTWKVLCGIFMPPFLLFIDFKTPEELQQMPQTEEEHLQELYSSSDSDSDTSVSTDEESEMAPRYFRRRKRKRQISERSATVVPRHETNGIQKIEAESSDSTTSTKLEEDTDLQVIIPIKQHLEEKDGFHTEGSSKCNWLKYTLNFFKWVGAFTKRNKNQLKLGKKLYEFYNAPVTKYWEDFVIYILFLFIYSYIVLVKTPPVPSSCEVTVWIFILSFFMESVRDFLCLPIHRFSRKFKTHFSDLRVLSETGAVLMFVIAVVFRLMAYTTIARVIYCVNIIYWYLRLFCFLIVDKHMGPMIHIAARNVMDMLQFLVILLIALMAFGINRQSIKFPNENFSWTSVKNIFLEPYFMLYGEVYAPDIDPACENDGSPGCMPGHFITPLTMSIYMIICNILLLSILIARLNSTYARISSNSALYWKFQRYHYVMRYESKPMLPSPLVIISLIIFLFKYSYRAITKQAKPFNHSLKLFLDDNEIENLYDFEEQCVEEYFYRMEKAKNEKLESKTNLACNRIELLTSKTDQLYQNNNAARLTLQSLEWKIHQLESQNALLIGIISNSPFARPSDTTAALSTNQNYDNIPPGQSTENLDKHRLETSVFDDTGKICRPIEFAQDKTRQPIILPSFSTSSTSEFNIFSQMIDIPTNIERPKSPSLRCTTSSDTYDVLGDSDEKTQGIIMDRVLRRRARKLSEAGDTSLMMLHNQSFDESCLSRTSYALSEETNEIVDDPYLIVELSKNQNEEST